jgi:hypothetical protein
MTVIDLIIKLQNLPPNYRVMIDVPHGGEMFKFADLIEVEHTQIESNDMNGAMIDIVMLSPYQMDIPEN